MKLLARIILLLLVLGLAFEALVAYVFEYRQGYSLWPLLGMGLAFWGYLSLRPSHKRPRMMAADVHSMDSFLLFLLTIAGAAFVLYMRGQEAFTLSWGLNLVILIFFLLLFPSVIAYPFVKRQSAVTMVVVFILLALLWKGERIFPATMGEGPITGPQWTLPQILGSGLKPAGEARP